MRQPRDINAIMRQLYRDLVRLSNMPPPGPRVYVAPPPLVDPDAELRAEVAQILRSQGASANMIAMATAGDNVLREAEKFGLL